MLRHHLVIAGVVAGLVLVTSCGGDSKKPAPKKPVVEEEEDPDPPRETAADRAAKREKQREAIVPEGGTCIPLALKETDSARLELAAVDKDAVLCAKDTDPERLLGVLGCWTVKLASGELAWRSREPVFSRGYMTKLDGKCVDGLCLPDDVDAPEGGKVLIALNADATRFAVLAGESVHLFDAEKKHEKTWGLRQEKGIASEPLRIHWVGESLFVEGNDGVWVYKAADGTAVGPIVPLGAKDDKPVPPPKGGTMVVLDKERVAISEDGFTYVHTYEADTGKRARLVRKLPRSPCKKADTAKYWGGEDVPAKCKDYMDKTFAHLVGADAVAGSRNLLVLLRGPRLGQLAVLDARTLAEKNAILLPWCEEGGGTGGDGESKKGDAEEEEEEEDE